MPKEEHSHSHSHPHRSHSKSILHRIRPEIFAIAIAIIVIILGAIAGERLKPSQRQPQTGSRASDNCGGTCTLSQACVCKESEFNWTTGVCNGSYYCQDKPATQEYCVHTICPVGYHCVKPTGAPSYCSPSTGGGGGIDCTGLPQCPSGSTMVCGAVTPHTYCGISKCECLSQHFPADFKFNEPSCWDEQNSDAPDHGIRSTCNTNCKCQPNVTITPTKPPNCPLPGAPAAQSPTGNLTCVNNALPPVTLRWTAAASTSYYYLRIDEVGNGVNGGPDWIPCGSAPSNPGDYCISNLTTTAYSFTARKPGKTYRWWVSSFNSCGQGTFSSILSFSVPSTCTIITVTPPASACSYFGIDENSGTDSQLVKINIAPWGFPSTSVSLIKTYPCSSGICEFETIDADNSGQLYGISNTKKALYKINKTTGALTLVANLNPAYGFISSSFRKSDNTLWGWSAGKGLYQINTATGVLTLKYASTLSYVDGMAWDYLSQTLYLSRTPLKEGSDAHLLRYTIAGGLEPTTYAKLPYDTDGLDSMPGENLLGAYHGGSGTVKVYRFNPRTKTVTDTYQISTPYTNLDSIVACVPN